MMSLSAQDIVQSGGTEQLVSRRHAHRLRSDKQAQPSDGVEEDFSHAITLVA